ncbi:hypothetical protein K7X08_012667 [Anisodus acutangulus]|uniref:Uncharacterized protein n=1 Tax=Anisodus acutangulus TaxID=402998 RepID=A0A9Q1RGT1_9SOLA|nr:hypothetical protein K7X08_012667 [Anisodus acutangulus]
MMRHMAIDAESSPSQLGALPTDDRNRRKHSQHRDNTNNLGPDGLPMGTTTPEDSMHTDGVTFEDGQTQYGYVPTDETPKKSIQNLRAQNVAMSEQLDRLKRFQDEFMSKNTGSTPTEEHVPSPNTHGETDNDKGISRNDGSKSEATPANSL